MIRQLLLVLIKRLVSLLFRLQILPGSTINLASPSDPHDSSDERLVEFNSNERSFTIRDYSRRVRGTDRYWSLPTQFLGNKVHLSMYALKPRLHQDTCCREKCVPDEQLVSGYTGIICSRTNDAGYMLLVLCNIITIHILRHGRLVSSDRRATNWQQFYCRYKKHVDGNNLYPATCVLV